MVTKYLYRFLLLSGVSILFHSTLLAQDGVLIDYQPIPLPRNPSALLELRSTDQGFLAPKVSIPDLNAAAPVSAPAQGLIVYNESITTGQGYFYWDGSKWTRLLNGSSAPPTGSGTLNYVAKWTPNGTTLGNSRIFDDGINVGIGTAVPAALLHLQSTNITDVPQGEIVLSRYWSSNANTRASSIFHYVSSATGKDNLAFAVSGDGGTYAQPNQLSQIKMIIQATGNVGISTVVPTAKLHVANTSGSVWTWTDLSNNVSLELGSNNNGNVGSIRLNSYTPDQFVFLRPSNGNYHVDATTGQFYYNWDESVRGASNGAMHIANEAGTETVQLNTAGNSYFTGGNVGIGEAIPTAKLHVAGGDLKVVYPGNDNPNKVLSTFHFTTNPGTNKIVHGLDFKWYSEYARMGVQRGSSTNLPAFVIGLNQAEPDQFAIASGGNVGIGTTTPASKLQVMGKVDIHQSGAGGGQNRFEGIEAATSANGRAQLVLSSAYSDLVIASSQANDNHGSTLTFATYDPSNAAQYKKWVVNQGNWGARSQFLDFGYGANQTNPHVLINGGNTTMSLDGINRLVGIGTTTPSQRLDVDGKIRMRTGATTGYIPVSSADGTMTWTDPTTITASDNDWAKVGGGTPTLIDEIYHTGNVGIGVIDPASVLHISTSQTGNVSKLHNPTLANGSLVGHEFGKANSINNMVEFRYNHISDGNAANYVNLGLWGNANSLVVQGSGNVGIGLTNPIFKLHVNGDIHPDGKFVVQNGVDGGNARGIWMWTAGDPNWGIYMGQAGAARALDGNTAVAGGGFSSHTIRFRAYNNSANGFVFENSSNQMLMSIRSDNGRTTFRGAVLFDCPDCGSTSTVDGNADWGDLVVQGRVISASSNLHLSPPGGNKVIINSTYRAAGGATGSTGLDIEDGGVRMKKSYYYFQRYRYCNCYGAGADTHDIGYYDFCAVAHVGFKNNQSSSDEDDDVQCAVYPTNHGGAGEQNNYTASYTYAYNARPHWRMYLEAYEDSNGVTCAASCMNFE